MNSSQTLKYGTGIAWLWTKGIPRYFQGCEYEISIERDLLSLKIYGSFTAAEFRKRRQKLCDDMRRSGHIQLYNDIGVYQRRTQ